MSADEMIAECVKLAPDFKLEKAVGEGDASTWVASGTIAGQRIEMKTTDDTDAARAGLADWALRMLRSSARTT